MEKGFVRFLKPHKINNRTFKKDEIVDTDEIGLTKEQFRALVERKAIIPCGTKQGVSHGGPVSIRG